MYKACIVSMKVWTKLWFSAASIKTAEVTSATVVEFIIPFHDTQMAGLSNWDQTMSI